MNEHSSRSHMIMTVNVTSENRVTGVVSRGKLNLVDLAGSERLVVCDPGLITAHVLKCIYLLHARLNKSGATGQALKEAQNINKSLLALGDVIAARAAKQNHVPFRNSTLTYLLQVREPQQVDKRNVSHMIVDIVLLNLGFLVTR